MHEERTNKHKNEDAVPTGAVPAYLLDREGVSRAKVLVDYPVALARCIINTTLQVLSNTVKQKRKEKAGKWSVPVPKVRPIAEAETFKVVKTGKRKAKSWKRMITKVTFVGDGFTRKPPKVLLAIGYRYPDSFLFPLVVRTFHPTHFSSI